MANNELPSDVPDVDRANATNPVGGGADEKPGQQPPGDFASHMKDKGVDQTTQPAKDPSPVELQQSQAASGPASAKTVQGQIDATNSSLSDVKNKLHTKGLKLKQGEKQTARDKLHDANDNIRSANKHLGADPGKPVNFKSAKNPIAKYLALVSDGQQQLNTATNMIGSLGQKSGQVSPAKMLLVQVKLAKAQQQIDYTSVLLGKAIDFLKTTMQTQI